MNPRLFEASVDKNGDGDSCIEMSTKYVLWEYNEHHEGYSSIGQRSQTTRWTFFSNTFGVH